MDNRFSRVSAGWGKLKPAQEYKLFILFIVLYIAAVKMSIRVVAALVAVAVLAYIYAILFLLPPSFSVPGALVLGIFIGAILIVRLLYGNGGNH
jgi:hypothetical protein